MEEYIKLFQNHTLYETYKNSADFITPNVSYCELQDEVHYNPWEETRLVCKFNITDTSSATPIMYSSTTSQFSEIEIDGVVQPNVVATYQFDITGEHIIKYRLINDTTFGNNAFKECNNLISVTIPNSVTSIGNYAFDGCSELISVTIPNSVTTIGNHAFSSCSSLTSITIPNSVTIINAYTFMGCSSLTEFNIPNSVTFIGDNAFRGCSGLISVTIGNSVTIIGMDAFRSCTGLTSIIIPDSVTTIYNDAFNGCTNLTSVTIGNSVDHIQLLAFAYCSNLTSLIIPSSVTYIGNIVFYNCNNLTSIISLATTAPTIKSTTFQNIAANGTLTVPAGSTGYNTWMGTGNYYLGKYNWTKVEQ